MLMKPEKVTLARPISGYVEKGFANDEVHGKPIPKFSAKASSKGMASLVNQDPTTTTTIAEGAKTKSTLKKSPTRRI